MTKRPKKLDLNQLAKRILDEATGQAEPTLTPPEKDKAATVRPKKDSSNKK